ncbi:MAG: nucleotidyltransferase family protein [Thermoanaerobaculia bacterium]
MSELSPGDPRHALLLQAALAAGNEAMAAYETWRLDVERDRPDSIAWRILPLAGWNLESTGLDFEDLPHLKQLHRESWARNQYLFAATAPAVEALERASIPTLLLKGAALALTVYPSPGLRPMADVDVLVPERLAAPARRVLAEAGWRPNPREPERRLAHLHAQEFVREVDGEPAALDLHWRALWEGREPAGDDAWWESAEPLCAGGFQSRVLAPADQLVQLCAHAARWSPQPACYAAADVVMLLRARGGRMDWERVAHQAAKRRLVLAVVTALAALTERFGAPVPPATLYSLTRMPVILRERAEFHARQLPSALSRGLFLHWCDLAREAPHASAARRLGRFPSYLREVWNLEHLWQVPVEATRKAWSRRPGPRGAGGPAWGRG